MLKRDPCKDAGSLPSRQAEYCGCQMGSFVTGQNLSFQAGPSLPVPDVLGLWQPFVALVAHT